MKNNGNGGINGLEGLFDEKKDVPTVPETSANEYNFLGRIAGSDYKPEDIIGIGIGSSAIGRGIGLNALFLTERGMKEKADPDLERYYNKLTSFVSSGALEPLSKVLSGQNFLEAIVIPQSTSTFYNLGGPKSDMSENRIMVVYVQDTTNVTFGRK